jgi:signal peptidase I
MVNGVLYINNKPIKREFVKNDFVLCGGSKIKSNFYLETLPNGKSYLAAYSEKNSSKDTDVYSIPQNKFFFMGDNRDCSQDSRYLSSVGYVDKLNLVGKAQILFFSNNEEIGNLFTVWKWHKSIRFNRILQFIK